MRGQLLVILRQPETLVCMVNDIIEELLDLAMEPEPGSLWLTRLIKMKKVQHSRWETGELTWDHRRSNGYGQGAQRAPAPIASSQHRVPCFAIGCLWGQARPPTALGSCARNHSNEFLQQLYRSTIPGRARVVVLRVGPGGAERSLEDPFCSDRFA